ncbi:MAG TPA: HAMP domain-containing sensor histidine kinase [Dehalococcoidia bacterium]|nr:HAMP domain-containing sensor histidine kinase [Dehalococcoidia bacterium]
MPRRLLTLPIFYKVLLANSAIVLLGALAGTAITAARVRAHPGVNVAELMAAFVLAGIVISVAVNAIVLRAALSPLLRIERTIDSVRAGSTSARVPAGGLTDPEIERLGETLNAMLDELDRARDRQTALAAQVISAQEEERRRISRELHDDTAQSLTSLLLYAKALEEGEQRPAVREALAEIRGEVGRSLDGVRRLARELRPSALDDLGLAAALDWHVQEFGRRTGLAVRFENGCAGERLRPAVELALFRVAQEALTNVAKHAGARSATVRLACSEHLVRLSVQDDGRGFDVAATPAGVGLYSMRERVALVRGAFTIVSGTHGSEVRAEVPRDGR